MRCVHRHSVPVNGVDSEADRRLVDGCVRIAQLCCEVLISDVRDAACCLLQIYYQPYCTYLDTSCGQCQQHISRHQNDTNTNNNNTPTPLPMPADSSFVTRESGGHVRDCFLLESAALATLVNQPHTFNHTRSQLSPRSATIHRNIDQSV